MGTKLKERLKGNGLFGTIKNVEALSRRAMKKISMKTSEGAIASSIPYETSEAHKAHMLEVEFRRSQALEEARRQNLRPR